MKRNNTWKWALVAFVVAWSLFELYPPTNRDLIDVFKKEAITSDATFQGIVEKAQELQKQFPERSYVNLREAVGTNDIRPYFTTYDVSKEKDPTLAILNAIQKKASGQVKLGLDLRGGTSFLMGVDTSNVSTNIDSSIVLSQAVEVLRRRVDKLGVAEPLIQPAGEDRILIQLPGISEADKESARRQLQRAAFLEFRMVHPESASLLAQGIIEPGYEKLTELQRPDSKRPPGTYLVKKKPERGLTGKYIKQAFVTRHQVTGKPEIDFTLDAEGADLFAQITREFRPVGDRSYQLAIVLDGELYSAPEIRGVIEGGRAQITGDFTTREAFELANVLENPLEAPVTILEERSVDPSLGKDSIRSGVTASVVGVILVAGFMLVYYLLAGVVANVALILNVLILFGVLAYLDATLTIPGIAGIVLTIGMAVDANVLIFERIREEIKAGKSIRGAITAGYEKAFSTIFDANVTTLIASVILIYMGTGPVKGFGVTLTIGVAVSMFTALVFTRLIFDMMVERNMLTSVKMLQLVGHTKFDFMKWAKPAFYASWLLILVGMGYGIFQRGSGVLGVDFAGGDTLVLRFDPANKVEMGQLRKKIEEIKVGETPMQYQRDVTSGTENLRITTAYNTGDRVEETLKEAFPQAKFERIALDKVGPVIGEEIQRSAAIAALLAMFGILVYVALRYEFSFAVAAVVAVVHDILMSLGWFFLTGRELNAPIVAAILTIIGFSMNDTIVIFDRIREDLKLGLKGTFREIINKALNQTLSRTVITSGTVFLATLSLYIFGGGVINDFAFLFLVGILTGTYSSIYIAGALVLWWHKGERPRQAATVSVEGASPATP